MIAVLSKPNQIPVVEEFFELFKTPWEFYRPGQTYDVIIATCDDVPPVDATLLIIYGSGPKISDARHGVNVAARHQGLVLSYGGTVFPIYGESVTFRENGVSAPCVQASAGVVGLRSDAEGVSLIRVGYDLFQEVQLLLSVGQPPQNAHIPSLDLHISMLREWIVGAGIPLLEIPPVPAGHNFAVCLTHDIDFIGIRQHKFDHTMWGFLYRSSIGSVRDLCRGRIPMARLFRMWRAAASLPFVYLGLAKDFWEPFGWYLHVEKDLPATHFFIPFKHTRGEKVPGRHAARRATAYDVTDLAEWTTILQNNGCEVGVHGIDAWHSAVKGREELARLEALTSGPVAGIRMHWLMQDSTTPSILEEAGYSYDSSAGYNETVGYRNGTTQVFRPLGTKTLLELPLHIQDGALFFSDQLDLAETEAETRCQPLIANAQSLGGVLTVLWHDRSHAPERFWGDFYITLVHTLKSLNAWFGTASQVVGWFRKRREVRFGRITAADGVGTSLLYSGDEITPPLRIRLHRPTVGGQHDLLRKSTPTCLEIAWNGRTALDVDSLLEDKSERSSKPSRIEVCSIS